MNARTTIRAAAAVAGVGALAALSGGLAHADTPVPSADGGPGPVARSDASSTSVFLLDGLPAAPVPEDLLKPVDLTAPVFGALDGPS